MRNSSNFRQTKQKDDYKIPKGVLVQNGKFKLCGCGKFNIGLEYEKCGPCETAEEVLETTLKYKRQK